MMDFYASNSLYGAFRTRKFTDLYPSVEKFLKDYEEIGIPQMISEQSAKTLYYLIIGKFGNSHIASSDENTFKARLFSIIFSDGLVWEQHLQTQQRIKDLSDEDLFTKVQTVYNRAQNPNEETKADELLDYISSQDVNKQKIGKLDAYLQYADSFKNCTDKFLNKFKELFITILIPDSALLYETDPKEGDENE